MLRALASPNLLAQVPINTSAFKPIPPWTIVFVASFILAVIVKRWGNKVTPDGHKWLDLLIDLFELLLVASAVAAAASTPLVGSAEKGINQLILNLHSHVGQLSIGLVAVILTVLVGWWYQAVEIWWVGIIFGLVFLVLCGAIPSVNTFMAWFINHIDAWMWNFLLSGFNWVFNRTFA